MKKVDSLTGVRIFAALAVLLSHLPKPPGALPSAIGTFMAAGYNGVTLFFCLSGFVLSWTYVNRRLTIPDTHSLWNFAVARIAR